MNSLHMHMYIVGCLTLAQLLAFYPAENTTTVTAKVAVQQNTKGEQSGKGK